MSAPPKPWEMAGVNNQNSSAGLPPCCQPESRAMPPPMMSGGALPQTLNPNPPPLPERPALGTGMSTYGGGMSSYGGYGGYGGMYGGGLGGYGGGSMYGSGMYGSGMYGSSMYGGGLGGYGGGMYGGGYGGMGGDYQPNSFVQQAEASSRQAFESIGSVVQVFGSVAMMLDSTFHAVYNSFRAVIGVADQFGRMKTHMTQIFSALAIIRGLKWLVKKVLVLLRHRAAGLPEDVWSQAVAQEGASVLAEGSGGKNWPIMLFFAMVFAGPWLIWKLLSSFSNSTTGKWVDGTCDHFLATAEYDFTGQGEQELSFHRGQKIVVAPKEIQPKMRGWLLASVDGKKEGIIPANYVKIMGKRKGQQANPPPPRPLQPSPSQGQFPSLNPRIQEDSVFNTASNNQDAWDTMFPSSTEKSSSDNPPSCEKTEEKKSCCGHRKDPK